MGNLTTARKKTTASRTRSARRFTRSRPAARSTRRRSARVTAAEFFADVAASETAAALFTFGDVVEPLTVKASVAAIGSELGQASKMPCATFGLSAADCKTGSRLARVAGSICASCYADPSNGGNYSYPSVTTSHARRLRALNETLPHAWVAAMVNLIARDGRPWFRWHDSGDVQSLSHLHALAEIARALPSVQFWLPTKEYKIVRLYKATLGAFPANLIVRLSAPMIGADLPASLQGLGLPYSVAVEPGQPQPVAHAVSCQAYADPDTPAGCGDCRACWNPAATVSYPVH